MSASKYMDTVACIDQIRSHVGSCGESGESPFCGASVWLWRLLDVAFVRGWSKKLKGHHPLERRAGTRQKGQQKEESRINV